MPVCLAHQRFANDTLIILEDLDAVGFPKRRTTITLAEMQVCLTWLAHFHATFLGKQPEHLWPIGSYWHLATRPEELKSLPDRALKNAAKAIDAKLSASPYQTLVHGDAKLANFCFSLDGRQVAAVDFQYVGGGCGMKDVAYFIDSCVSENQLEQLTPQLLDFYFQALKQALRSKQKPVTMDALEQVHTSGHAILSDLKAFANATNSRVLIPIHTFEASRYSDIFENVKVLNDKEAFVV